MKKNKLELIEIHGFTSLGEYQLFIDFINEHIVAGNIKEVSIDYDYGKGEIYGGKWFLNNETNEIWRLVPPDFPFKGLFEKVNNRPSK